MSTTQDGIATALNLSRAHVALELKRLRAKRLVEGTQAHVTGSPVRRKVYRALDEARHAVYKTDGQRMPLVQADVRTLEIVVLRCPNCGKESRVALEP